MMKFDRREKRDSVLPSASIHSSSYSALPSSEGAGTVRHAFTSLVTELGGAMQLMGILRLLLDPENMLATANVSPQRSYGRSAGCCHQDESLLHLSFSH